MLAIIPFMKLSLVTPSMHYLSLSNWGDDRLSRRSEKISPLYVERPIGVQNKREFTYHEFPEIIYIFKGSADLIWLKQTKKETVEKKLRMRSGTFALIPQGVPHYEYGANQFDRIYVGIKGSLTDEMNGSEPLLTDSPHMEQLCQSLWAETHIPGALMGPEIDAWMALIVHRALRILKKAQTETTDCIDKAVQFLHENYSSDITVTELADRYGYSEGYFYRQFKERTGETPKAFLNEIRIRQAIHMLRNSTLPVKKIAPITGFHDSFYFSRIFRQITGQSPTQIREAGRDD
ncbi:MAG: helix-turn-helix transcriptional regulator [Planctomycetes bacterium]|nr:helix-turn-helix transcriptional regulator [Planctomycetota bacterium]